MSGDMAMYNIYEDPDDIDNYENPNEPYFFWVEMSRAWADDSNDVSHLTISHL